MTWTDGVLTVPRLEESRAVEQRAGTSRRKRVGKRLAKRHIWAWESFVLEVLP